MLRRNTIFFACLLTSTMAYGQIDYFLIPGFGLSGADLSREVTLVRNNRMYGDYDGNGVVYAEWLKPSKEKSIEFQRHIQGHPLFGASIGGGVYKTESSQGLQATVTLQYYTPFLVFVREQIQTVPRAVAKRPQFGFMFKFPLPIGSSSEN